MSSSGGIPPLIGTAARRRRALAHLSPIFDLHLYRARNSSAVDWATYDFIALVQLAVDTIALSSGLDGNLGAPRPAVLAEMARTAAAMAPHRPPDEHMHVATHILDRLLRHDEPTPYFAVDYADPDTCWQTVTQQVRVLYETLAADGSTLHVNVDNTAVTLLLIATNRSLEDEHEAVIAVMQAQADSGRFEAAMDSAEDALTLSRTYAANVRRMIIEAERDVTRVDYLNTLRPELTSATAHLDRRIRIDGTFLRHLENLRADASEQHNPDAVRQLTRAASRLGDALETLAALQTDVVGAAPRWREAQAAQAFTAVLADEVDLDPDGRGGRRHVDDLAAAIRAQVGHVDADAVPELVRDTIRRGEQQGRWVATRTVTVQRGRATLPKSVTLPFTGQPTDRLAPVGVPLRDELASWAAPLRLSASQRQLIVAVNEWLRRTDGGNVPIVEAAERAYELLGDEKAFDSSPPRGGTTLWHPDRLTFEMLRCERTATPLAWEPVTLAAGTAGPVVCVENHATFRTLLRVLRAHPSPPWAAVAWVQGRNTAPLESLTALPFAVMRLDYLGDLDAAGLAIATAACATARKAGVPAGPAAQLWALLIERPTRAGYRVGDIEARTLVTWLPEPIRERAYALLVEGRVIPQEALRFDVLAEALSRK